MSDREELMALRRMAELEAKASGSPSAVSPAPTPKPADKPTGNLLDAVAEPLIKLGSGIIAKPASDIAGLAKGGYDTARRMLGYGQQGPDAEETQRAVQQFIQYDPSTQVGSSPYNPLNAIPNAIGSVIEAMQPKAVTGEASTTLSGMTQNAIREAIPQAIGLLGMKSAPKVVNAANATGSGVRNVADRLLPGGTERGQARVMADAAGSDIAEIVNALQRAKQGETAGQAAVGVGRREFSALDQFGSKIDPTPYGRMMEAQKAADLDFLNRQAGGLTREQQFATQNALKQAETAPIVQRGQVELGAANQAGETIAALGPRAAAARDTAANMVQGVRDFTAAGARADALAQNYTPVAGQPRIAGRYSYADELAKRAERVAQQSADSSLQQGAQARFIENQIGSLESHGLKPLNVDSAIGKIDSVLSTPGLRMSDTVKTVLGGIKEKFLEAKALGNGIPNAHDIYRIRMEGVNEVIQQKLAGLDPKASKKLSADLTVQLKPFIDDAIETAGGTGWKQYLDDYSKAMTKVGQTKLAGKLAADYQASPSQFQKVALGNDPKAVGKAMGKNEPMALLDADPVAGPRYREIAEALVRNENLAKQAGEGAPALSNMVSAEVTSGGRLPGMISREVTIINSILDALHGRANAKTMQKVAETMRDPVASRKVLEAIIESRKPTVAGTVMPYAVGAQFAPQGE